jgi:hypothetical protein
MALAKISIGAGAMLACGLWHNVHPICRPAESFLYANRPNLLLPSLAQIPLHYNGTPD